MLKKKGESQRFHPSSETTTLKGCSQGYNEIPARGRKA